MIQDACKALGEGEDEDGVVRSASQSRRGAAVGFLRTLEGLLKKVAQAGLHERYVEQTIESALEWRRNDAQAAEDEKADFVRRMKRAKAAKAEARLSPGNLPGNCGLWETLAPQVGRNTAYQ